MTLGSTYAFQSLRVQVCTFEVHDQNHDHDSWRKYPMYFIYIYIYIWALWTLREGTSTLWGAAAVASSPEVITMRSMLDRVWLATGWRPTARRNPNRKAQKA